jgi:hypothetical protein
MLAALGTQSLTLEQLRGMKTAGKVVRPQKDRFSVYREGYTQFLRYYRNNRKDMKEYNRSRQ